MPTNAPPNLVQHNSWKTSHPIPRKTSPKSSYASAVSTSEASKLAPGTRIPYQEEAEDEEEDYAFSDLDEMDDRRPNLHRPTDGRSEQPLLRRDSEDDVHRGRQGYSRSPDTVNRRPAFSRRSTLRSRSPDTQAKMATRKKYTYAAFFLGLSLISFVVQTETAVYIQHQLGWNKAYCML